ncbi:GNAT family N-acetyltransferase [Salinicola halophilus]|uniref:GNAT family N-acetyltransferase n=1 Tax=Salinicola halophilus TaxID=184065 RepID=UPI000DA1AF8B|nr:GNAT family N-acetyltransferase [Salinicola halophilus]
MSEWTLSRLTPDSSHLETLAGLTHAEWGYLYPEESLTQWTDHMRASCGSGGVPSVFVATVRDAGGERVVGTASLLSADLPTRPALSPWLASVLVLPGWRGRGIASALIDRVHREAEAHAVTRCYLYTPDQQALYARLGWRSQETLTYRNAVVTVMTRDMSAPGFDATTLI